MRVAYYLREFINRHALLYDSDRGLFDHMLYGRVVVPRVYVSVGVMRFCAC